MTIPVEDQPLTKQKLPNGWIISRVGELAVQMESGFSSGAHNKDGQGIVHLRPMNIDALGRIALDDVKSVPAATHTKRVGDGDVLFNNTNSSWFVGKTAAVRSPGDWGFSNHMTRVRPHDDILPEFLASQLHYLWMIGYTGGLCTKHVNQASVATSTLSQIPIVLAPRLEQGRIVEEINTQLPRLDAASAELENQLAKLAAYRAAVLRAACEGRLVPTEAEVARAEGRTFVSAASRFGLADVTSGPVDLPEGWTWSTLGALKDFSLYGPRFSSDDYAPDGVLVLRTSDLSESGKVNLATPPRIRLSRDDLERYRVTRGDILITRTGSLGTLAIFDDYVEAIPGAYLIQYRLKHGRELASFVALQLHSPRAQSVLRASGFGVGRPNLNVPTIDAIPLSIPPAGEQSRIVAEVERRLSVVERLESAIDANLARAKRLRQAILKRAFEGRLVPQDPSDEPAGVLLERIRREREAQLPRVAGRKGARNGRPSGPKR